MARHFPMRWFSLSLVLLVVCCPPATLWGDAGSLTIHVRDEASGEPTITRMELSRAEAPTRMMPIRKGAPAGIGVILDRSLELSLPEAAYQFRMIRGPEYRIVSGTFALERTSLDSHKVDLPRMIHMRQRGWTSGDCGLPASPISLPLRMASEDLHVAASFGHLEPKPIAGRDPKQPLGHDPVWIRHDATPVDGLILYGFPTDQRSTHTGAREESSNHREPSENRVEPEPARLAVEWLVERDRHPDARIGVENPFAWPLPVWLASNRIDGIFLLGDWLRLDRQLKGVPDGRGPQGPTVSDGKTIGRWAERIYWNVLEAGLRIPPLAGSGDQPGTTPAGYNRLYVAAAADAGRGAGDANPPGPLDVRAVESEDQWWEAAWRGQSVATNGPLLCPKLGGEIPGHVFRGGPNEVLVLQPELTLSVRDPVDYLEVIHNSNVHYSARLDEFAKAGGVIPPIHASESGWVTIRVVTLFEDHFRAAMSAPWYIEFDSRPRITKASVEFFQNWLGEYEQRLRGLPPNQLQRHAPFIRAARAFWQDLALRASD